MKYTRLGDLLIDAGVIDEEQLSKALAAQKETHQRLGETLISTGVITRRQLIEALQVQLGIDYIDLSEIEIDPEMTKLVPRNLAKKNSIVPVRTRGDELYLAMSDPLNFIATEEARAASRKRIVPMIATQSGIDHAISVLYGTVGAKRAIREMQQEAEQSDVNGAYSLGLHTNDLDSGRGSSAPSIRLVDNIIERGITDRASDIHVEPQDGGVRVRMRIDGVLHEEFQIPKELQQSLTSRIKVMCGMDVTERRVPQDGRAIVSLHGKEADLRVSTLPTVHGEKIVIRILDRDNKLDTAEELGFYGHNLEEYNRLVSYRQGVILLVGPTGSGKSSTLFTIIGRLNTEGVNIITLEDPVEYSIEGVTQVQVNDKAGTTFADGLRSALRQDPDIISVGEIRDSETADIAMRAAVTGHLVLSTIHANDAISTLDRLSDIGVEPYMQATALRGIVSQRLVRCICPHCKEAYVPDADEIRSIGIDPTVVGEDIKFYRGRGCPECYGTGYRGRTVVAEVLRVTGDVRAAIHEGDRNLILEAVRRTDFEPINVNARELVLSGKTTVNEVLRAVYVSD